MLKPTFWTIFNTKHYFKRFLQLGIKKTNKKLYHKIKRKIFCLKWKQKALKLNANYQWTQIAKKHSLASQFELFFKKLSSNNFVTKIEQNNNYLKYLPQLYKNKQNIIEQANNFCNNCFDLLGSGKTCFGKTCFDKTCFDKTQIPWHYDFKLLKYKNTHLQNNWCMQKINYKNLLFYQDISINNTKTCFDNYNPDIKVPWELSRFQHIFFLGKAYQLTKPNNKNETYALTFEKQINNWIKQNPFLLGVNWICPMDVAIRAINWIWGFYYFKNSSSISKKFWETLVCSLYDHAFYLKNNFELSDKPNNHYISDLVGYFYLCSFFSSIPYFKKAQQKTFKTILYEFKRQVSNDGTSYEGSTSYHMLVTELFWHFSLLCQAQNILLPKTFLKKLNLMFNFLNHCKITKNNIIQIGDNDSGKIVTGIQPQLPNLKHVKEKNIFHYPNFGITIIKNNNWHISFRHSTFSNYQPTGHFHQDQLSITLTIDKIPILVDPGSYLYTANHKWRNKFRSTESHNTFYFTQQVNNKYLFGHIPKTLDLFQLPKLNQKDPAKIIKTEENISIQSYHNEYQKLGLKAFRKINLNKKNKTFYIKDWFENNQTKTNNNKILNYKTLTCKWSLLLHPKINIEKIDNQTWVLYYNNNKIATLNTGLNLIKETGFYSPNYGIIQQCTKLIAHKKIDSKQNLFTIYFSKSN